MGAGSEEEEESDGWSDEGSDSDAEEEGGEGDGKKDGSDGDAGDGATTGGEGGGGKKDGGKKGKKQEGGYDYFDEFIDDEGGWPAFHFYSAGWLPAAGCCLQLVVAGCCCCWLVRPAITAHTPPCSSTHPMLPCPAAAAGCRVPGAAAA